jgi:hypothetical protein
MPFIDKAIVCVPDSLEDQFHQPISTLALEVITESSILSSEEIANLSNLDHQRRNFLLRSKLVNSNKVDSHFIMSDDDARPLKPVTIETFIKEGRYRRYFFYDLASWGNNQTEFDLGQISTYAVLDCENLEHLSYASHMPQIIDRKLFRESTTFFQFYSKQHPLCEWSTYFNYAANRHPEKFQPPEAFVTLCWPEHPLAWVYDIKPASCVFENYTPNLYRKKGVFKNLITSPESHSQTINTNIEKIILWKKQTIACLYPEQAKGLTKYFRLRTWINKLFKHL